MSAPNDPDAGSLDPASGTMVAPETEDILTGVLGSVRMNGALFFMVDATSPWCVDIPETRAYSQLIQPHGQHVLSYHVIVEGEGFASVPGIGPVPFSSGDIIVFPHGDPYVMTSAPGTPPELDFDETLQFFRALADGTLPFVVTEGGGAPPPARFICGFLGLDARPFNPVLAGLPRLLRLERPGGGRGDRFDRLIAMTMEEARDNRAGGGSVRQRLSELLFIELLRSFADGPGPKPTGWLAGLHDARIARALAALHDEPQAGWSVERLATIAGMSRSTFAETFGALVGLSPIRYLTHWRMHLAADLLKDPARPIADIAARTGYASEAAFSRSFRRVTGTSPDTWRRGSVSGA